MISSSVRRIEYSKLRINNFTISHNLIKQNDIVVVEKSLRKKIKLFSNNDFSFRGNPAGSSRWAIRKIFQQNKVFQQKRNFSLIGLQWHGEDNQFLQFFDATKEAATHCKKNILSLSENVHKTLKLKRIRTKKSMYWLYVRNILLLYLQLVICEWLKIITILKDVIIVK